MSALPKVIVIVGPTAAGKTACAIAIAHYVGGEVVSADSRQVYRGLDLASGKVTKEEMEGVPHHLLDVVDIASSYNAAQFSDDAHRAIDAILARNNVPIIAGGTFFYIDVLLGRTTLSPVAPQADVRAHLEAKDTATLFDMLCAADPARAATVDARNKRRLIRALEIVQGGSPPPAPRPHKRYDALMIGITINRDSMRARIRSRIVRRIRAGMIEEVAALHHAGISWKRLDELGLEPRFISRYLQGELTKTELVEQLSAKTWQFAKRQRAWYKRCRSIRWYAPYETAQMYRDIDVFLSRPTEAHTPPV